MGGTAQHLVDVPRRIGVVEDHVKEQRELNMKLTEGLWALRTALEKGTATVDAALTAMSTRIQVHDDRRAFWLKVSLSVVSALALMLIVWLARISYIVQSNKLP
jgi:hypothetical protein